MNRMIIKELEIYYLTFLTLVRIFGIAINCIMNCNWSLSQLWFEWLKKRKSLNQLLPRSLYATIQTAFFNIKTAVCLHCKNWYSNQEIQKPAFGRESLPKLHYILGTPP